VGSRGDVRGNGLDVSAYPDVQDPLERNGDPSGFYDFKSAEGRAEREGGVLSKSDSAHLRFLLFSLLAVEHTPFQRKPRACF